MNSIASFPRQPKILADLTVWESTEETEIDISDCRIAEADFSNTLKLEMDGCSVERISLSAKLQKLVITDAKMKRVEAAGLQADKVSLRRVVLENSRFTGADFAEGQFEDCVFRNVKFDEAGFRSTTLERVKFENCVLRATDFSGASLTNVTFEDCEFDATNFDKASCTLVDIRGEDLSLVKGLTGLKGSIISYEQLIQIAPLLATELGFKLDNNLNV